jgi:hypothetical protein
MTYVDSTYSSRALVSAASESKSASSALLSSAFINQFSVSSKNNGMSLHAGARMIPAKLAQRNVPWDGNLFDSRCEIFSAFVFLMVRRQKVDTQEFENNTPACWNSIPVNKSTLVSDGGNVSLAGNPSPSLAKWSTFVWAHLT